MRSSHIWAGARSSLPKRADATMRVLLSNDDGYHAPGLAVLEEIAARLSDDVWVCAPAEE